MSHPIAYQVIDTPTTELMEEFMASHVHVTRFCDIYESDGTTLWREKVPLEDFSVSVDMGRDERRNVSATVFDNGEIGYGPNGGLWYDKIVKPYRGILVPGETLMEEGYVEFPASVSGNSVSVSRTAPTDPDVVWRAEFDRPPNPAASEFKIISTFPFYIFIYNSAGSVRLYAALLASDASQVQALMDVTLISDFVQVGEGMQVKAVWETTAGTGTLALHWRRKDLGRDLLDDTDWVLLFTSAPTAKAASTFTPWSFSSTTATQSAGCKVYRATLAQNGTLEIDVDFRRNFADDQATSFTATTGQTVTVTRAGTTPLKLVPGEFAHEIGYVAQLGEFMIDSMERPHHPSRILIQGRDMTKKLKLSRFLNTTTFAANTVQVVDLIQIIASNGGITKFKITPSTELLANPVTFEKDSERFQAIKTLADSIAYEVFFDRTGYMVARPYPDPHLSAAVLSLTTGEGGNLSKYSRKADDTRMFNQVVVRGSGQNNGLVFGSATNSEPLSPTSTVNIGERTMPPFENPIVKDNAAATLLALSILNVAGLESYDVTLDTLTVPWLEASEVIEFIPTEGVVDEPTKYLLTSFTITGTLGPMSGTAKRVWQLPPEPGTYGYGTYGDGGGTYEALA